MANSIYNPVSLEVGNILKDVKSGKIGLPDLQRPFVWTNSKVRDLLDSMLRGYPIGYIMLWDSPAEDDKKSQIGTNEKAFSAPKELVIDGQQRLTALLASLYGIEVRDKNFQQRPIRIAYDPINRAFKNADVSTEKDPRWVSSVSDVFESNRLNNLSKFRRNFVKAINASNEKMVADIFVRVNSQGQTLKQDDFIMTLLSVYEPGMRNRIEGFCADSHMPAKGTSYNPLITITPTHVIRATVGVGFKRGRLRYAYQILRGRDLETKETSPETREKSFETFGAALDRVLDLNNWHAFINTVGEAGDVSSSQISSDNALMFNYALYLIGRYEFGMDPLPLKRRGGGSLPRASRATTSGRSRRSSSASWSRSRGWEQPRSSSATSIAASPPCSLTTTSSRPS